MSDGVDLERLLTTLSGDLALLHARVQALEDGDLPGRLDELSRQLEAVVTSLQTLTAADKTARVQVWDWTQLDTEQAAEAWTQLLDWMRTWLAPRVPQLLDSGLRPWQPCWYRHPDVLDELTVLHATWKAAYQPKASPTLAAEWRDRWLPTALRRIQDATRPCGRAEGDTHKDPAPQVPLANDADLSAFIEADLANRPPPTSRRQIN